MRSRRECGFTLVELLVVVAIIGILASVAIPGLLRARIAGNEASAIGSLRSIVSAESAYAAHCASGQSFAVDLTVLGAGAPPFLSPDLTASNPIAKSGYTITLGPGAGAIASGALTCPGAQTAFYASATPLTLGSTGNRAFAVNTAGSVWQDFSGVAPTEPFTAGGSRGPLQ